MNNPAERFPRVNAMAREEGWGVVTDAALGILPEDVETQARGVARWAAASIEELEAENFALAAQQCLFSDGSGLCGDEWGHQYCAMKRRAEAAEAKLATATEALKRIAYHVPSFDYAGRDEYGHIRADLPGSPYDRGKADGCKMLSGIAEDAIRALKSTTQT